MFGPGRASRRQGCGRKKFDAASRRQEEGTAYFKGHGDYRKLRRALAICSTKEEEGSRFAFMNRRSQIGSAASKAVWRQRYISIARRYKFTYMLQRRGRSLAMVQGSLAKQGSKQGQGPSMWRVKERGTFCVW